MAKMAEQMELFNEGGVSLRAKDILHLQEKDEETKKQDEENREAKIAKLNEAVLEKNKNRKNQMVELTRMLTSGEVKDLPLEEQENLVKLYKLLESQGYGIQNRNEGGLMDEGGTTDPVSGNDVPPGSTQEEVRDDIPAQLSEGEFVFPADVVRYIGLETLMRMRQEAKMGLSQMEAMGQMGNGDEATIPDDLPFNMYDLEIEDDGLQMNQGGVIQAANGTLATNTNTGAMNPVTNQFQPFAGMSSTQPQPLGTAFAAPIAASSAYNPRLGGTFFTPTTPEVQYAQPTLYGTAGFGPEGVQFEQITTKNEQGQTLKFKRNKQTGQIFDLEGNPSVIPEGYVEEVKEEEQVQTTPTTGTGVKTARVVDEHDDKDMGSPKGATVAFGGTPDGKGLVNNAFTANVKYTGFNLGDTAAFGYTQGGPSMLNALSGGKYGQPITLNEESQQGAIFENIINPNTKQKLGFNLKFNAEQFNRYFSRSGPAKVSQRKELEEIVTQLSKIDDVLTGDISMDYANFLSERMKQGQEDDIRDSLEKSKDFKEKLASSLEAVDFKRDKTGGLFGTDLFATEKTGAISAEERSRMSDAQKKAADAAVMSYVKSMMDDKPADDDELFTPGSSARVKTTLGQDTVTEKSGDKTVSEVAKDPGVNAAYKDLLKNIETANLTGRQLNHFLDNVISQSEPFSTKGIGSDWALDYTPEITEDMAANYQIAANMIKEEQAAKEEEQKLKRWQQAIKKQRELEQAEQAEQDRRAKEAAQYASSIYDTSDDDGPQIGGGGVSRDVREAVAEAGGYTGGGKYGGFAKGGLAKQMKRSGLASKK